MNLKLLRSALCLVSVIALLTDGALAQAVGAGEIRAKLAEHYNAGKYRDVIADAAALQKLNALSPQMALVTAQSYFKLGDYAGCVNYIQEQFGSSPSGDPLELQSRCKMGR